jgi:hypothetical protein
LPCNPGDPPKGHDSRPPQNLIIPGIILLENGSLPLFGVIIEHDCDEGFTKEAETNASGCFFFFFQIRKSSGGRSSFPDSCECENASDDALVRRGLERKGTFAVIRGTLRIQTELMRI